MKKLVILGAGTMGMRICRHFLNAGHPTAMVDPSDDAFERARKFLEAPNDHAGTLPLIVSKLSELPVEWQSAALVIESVPEMLDLKRQVIGQIEAFFGADTIIASNTSGLRCADLAEGMQRPERFLITHFFNPADLIPAVEVVPGPLTDSNVVERTCTILDRSGKKAASLNADVPGFIANRLQHALMRECFHLVENGVADPSTIDHVARYSIGVRFALIGPFLQRDANGLDTHARIAEYLYPDLGRRESVPDLLAEKLAAGETGRKAGKGFYRWDDRQEAMMKELEHLLPQVIALSAQLDDTEKG